MAWMKLVLVMAVAAACTAVTPMGPLSDGGSGEREEREGEELAESSGELIVDRTSQQIILGDGSDEGSGEGEGSAAGDEEEDIYEDEEDLADQEDKDSVERDEAEAVIEIEDKDISDGSFLEKEKDLSIEAKSESNESKADPEEATLRSVMVRSLRCFYRTNSSTFSSLPDSLCCSCDGRAETFQVLNATIHHTLQLSFQWASMKASELHLSSILLTNCSSLVLDLQHLPSSPSSLPSLTVESTVKELNLLLSAHSTVPLTLSMEGVARVVVTVAGEQEEATIFPLVLGFGVVVLLLLATVLLLLLCLWRAKRGEGEEHKKVSRAESWRYESSIYVQPPPGAGGRSRPVYVAPPLPPPSPPAWREGEGEGGSTGGRNGGSSTPLLRTQYGVRGVDVVRTSLNSRCSRERGCCVTLCCAGRRWAPRPPTTGRPGPGPGPGTTGNPTWSASS